MVTAATGSYGKKQRRGVEGWRRKTRRRRKQEEEEGRDAHLLLMLGWPATIALGGAWRSSSPPD